jgi:hypothetical protein
MDIAILPKSWTLTATNLRIHIVEYQLKKSARIVAQLLDDGSKLLDREVLVIEGPDFEAWGYDDTYIVHWVCQKLNLTLDPSRPIQETVLTQD